MTACKRAWEVEAARDGRLGAQERQRLSQHLASCAVCQREREELEVLAERLRAQPVPAADELRVRRSRKLVLERANEQRYDRSLPASSGARKLARASAAAACLIGLTLGLDVLWHSYTVTHAPEVAFEADPDTRYRRGEIDGTTVVDLLHGRLTLHIGRGERARGVLVRTPDGEIEDVGTVFTVDVDDGRTRYVGVREGRVLMRLKDRPQRVLVAGQSVRPYDGAPESSAPEVTQLPAPQPASQPAPPRRETPRLSAHAAHRHVPHDRHVAEAGVADAPVETAAGEFTEAVARLEAGDLASAAALFHRFVRRHPDDVRAEDAAFLRVVALTRADQTDEARAAADSYLRQHPAGFRVKEVERLRSDLQRGAR